VAMADMVGNFEIYKKVKQHTQGLAKNSILMVHSWLKIAI